MSRFVAVVCEQHYYTTYKTAEYKAGIYERPLASCVRANDSWDVTYTIRAEGTITAITPVKTTARMNRLYLLA